MPINKNRPSPPPIPKSQKNRPSPPKIPDFQKNRPSPPLIPEFQQDTSAVRPPPPPIPNFQRDPVMFSRTGEFDDMMANQVYQNLLERSSQQAALFNDYMNQGMGISNALTAATSGQAMRAMPQQTIGTIPQQPIPIQMPVVQQGQQQSQLGRIDQQAMQNYQNLVGQGIANMQAMGRTPPLGQLTNQPQIKPSTSSFRAPRPLG